MKFFIIFEFILFILKSTDALDTQKHTNAISQQNSSDSGIISKIKNNPEVSAAIAGVGAILLSAAAFRASKSNKVGLKKSAKSTAKLNFAATEASLMAKNTHIPPHASYNGKNNLRLMTYNVALLKNPTDGLPNTSKVINVIRQANPDILTLQEIPQLSKQAAILHNNLLSLGYTSFIKGFNTRLNGRVGNVIYSKLPLESTFKQNLAFNPKLYRNAVGAQVDYQGSKLLILGTHLSHGGDKSLLGKELNAINDLVLKQQLPNSAKHSNSILPEQFSGQKRVIVMGDFNTNWENVVHRLHGQRKIPSSKDSPGYTNWQYREIDHVSMDAKSFKDMNLKTFQMHTDASDHLPVIADIGKKQLL